ncbi:MAG: hypothetical protein HYV09_16880 [Deltaproteobacteria bacterium]|nr:hypothetical protein [Deltaproteobacteria bacterium]
MSFVRSWHASTVAAAVALVTATWAGAARAITFPADSAWVPLSKSGAPVNEPVGDATGGGGERDLVGDATNPGAYMAMDGAHLFFRVRVNGQPQFGSPLEFRPFGWGCAVDSDGNAQTLEFWAVVNGIAETVSWNYNSTPGTANSIGDAAETSVQTLSPTTYSRVVSAGTIFPTSPGGTPDPDYFIDWAIPLGTLRSPPTTLGVTIPPILEGQKLRFACGTASNGTTMNADPYGTGTVLDAIMSDPVICGSSGCSLDTDGDGVGDALEATLGTDPSKADSDGDGINDNIELSASGTAGPFAKVDTDGDGVIDALDTDSDNDCVTDKIEGTAGYRNALAPSGDKNANCSGTAPVCVVTTVGTCSACNGDYGTPTSRSCFAANPYCVLSGTTAGTCGKCTSNADCAGAHAGPFCDTTTGGCGSSCTKDEDCLSAEWCNAGTCAAKLPNGTSIPSAVGGSCTTLVGARVCSSGVCSTTDDKCGVPTGGTCGAGTECRSTFCSGSTCVACTADSHCGGTSSGMVCTGAPLACASGCRATGGNGCPLGQICSSTGAEAGVCQTDTDGDGVPDATETSLGTKIDDTDSDDDGLADNVELSATGGTRPFSAIDTDGDGVIDALDKDSDNDCVPDALETLLTFRDAAAPNAVASANCSGATPICDTTSGACSACNGDNGATATRACLAAAPLCLSTGACAKCTTNADCVGHAGPFCEPTTGACAAKCTSDAQCTATQWCETTAGNCTPKLANGEAIPSAVGGACTTTIGARVCTSSVCSAIDHKCGSTPGEDCAGGTTCRDGFCVSGKCAGCAADADCGAVDSGKVCTGTPQVCAAGCRGTGGNGCAAGELCSSKTSAVGACEKDTDGDGVTDALETTLGTDATKKDSDGDGIFDNIELSSTGGAGPFAKIDTDGDGTIDALDLDADNDCVTDAVEGTTGYRDAALPNTRASDNCGGAKPICNVTSGACVACSEDAGGTAATACSTAAPYCFLSGTTAGACGKCEKDADCATGHPGPYCDTASGACGTKCTTDAQCKATEWCGDAGVCTAKLPNGDPVPASVGGKCTTDLGKRVCVSGICSTSDDRCGVPLDATCAGDGECRSAVCVDGKCVEKDTDGDGVPDELETKLGTDPAKKDSDGDGIPDNVELSATGGTGPYTGVDTDTDGTIDALDLDADGDGVADGSEGTEDADGDKKPNFRDTDDDDDGILTADELADAKKSAVSSDVDGDGKPNYLDTDADGDGLLDKDEGRGDPNGNGVSEYLDPFVPAPDAGIDSAIVDDAGAEAGAPAVDTLGTLEGGGCGCTTAGRSGTTATLGAVGLLLAGLSVTRRRRR